MALTSPSFGLRGLMTVPTKAELIFAVTLGLGAFIFFSRTGSLTIETALPSNGLRAPGGSLEITADMFLVPVFLAVLQLGFSRVFGILSLSQGSLFPVVGGLLAVTYVDSYPFRLFLGDVMTLQPLNQEVPSNLQDLKFFIASTVFCVGIGAIVTGGNKLTVPRILTLLATVVCLAAISLVGGLLLALAALALGLFEALRFRSLQGWSRAGLFLVLNLTLAGWIFTVESSAIDSLATVAPERTPYIILVNVGGPLVATFLLAWITRVDPYEMMWRFKSIVVLYFGEIILTVLSFSNTDVLGPFEHNPILIFVHVLYWTPPIALAIRAQEVASLGIKHNRIRQFSLSLVSRGTDIADHWGNPLLASLLIIYFLTGIS